MAATVTNGEVYRAMLEKLNEVEATKRLLEYDVQTQLLKTEEINTTRKALEQEIREIEAEIEAAKRVVEQKNVQFMRCQEAQLSIERSIEHETSSHATLKQELEETMTTRRQRIEDFNRETCRRHCQIHEILCQVGVESTLALPSTTDAEAQTRVDAKITSAHADIDARIIAALTQNKVTRALGKKDEALLRSVYTCFKQAKTSLQKHGDRFESALLKTKERIQQIWPYRDSEEDPAELELKFRFRMSLTQLSPQVDELLQAELPEACLKAFGNPTPTKELLVVSQLMNEDDWILQPSGYLLGNAFLQNMLGESKEDTDASSPQNSPAADGGA